MELLGDAQWIERSATRAVDADYPDYARLIHSGSAIRLEMNRPISQGFIDAIGTLEFHYFARITRMTSATDEPLVPANLRHHLAYGGAYLYALGQGDDQLAARLKPRAELAKVELLRQDLTRTGRPRQLRPTYSYTGMGRSRRRVDGYVDS